MSDTDGNGPDRVADALVARRAAPGDLPPSRVRLRILDKEVQLACPPDEEDKLRQAAAYVDRAMRETRQRNTTSSLEKIAIVTAINTASSLLDARSRAGGESGVTARVARLNERLDELLAGGVERPAPLVDVADDEPSGAALEVSEDAAR